MHSHPNTGALWMSQRIYFCALSIIAFGFSPRANSLAEPDRRLSKEPHGVIVTGGSGFLGSHVGDALSAGGHETVIFDLARSRWLRSDQQMVIGSVLDPEAVNRAVRGSDAVYHLAAM